MENIPCFHVACKRNITHDTCPPPHPSPTFPKEPTASVVLARLPPIQHHLMERLTRCCFFFFMLCVCLCVHEHNRTQQPQEGAKWNNKMEKKNNLYSTKPCRGRPRSRSWSCPAAKTSSEHIEHATPKKKTWLGCWFPSAGKQAWQVSVSRESLRTGAHIKAWARAHGTHAHAADSRHASAARDESLGSWMYSNEGLGGMGTLTDLMSWARIGAERGRGSDQMGGWKSWEKSCAPKKRMSPRNPGNHIFFFPPMWM